MALFIICQALSSSVPMVALSLNSSASFSSSKCIQNPPGKVVLRSSCWNPAGIPLNRSQMRSLQVVRMAPEDDKTTRRSSSDFAADGAKGKEQKWTEEGTITESLPNGMFRINLDNAGLVLGYISGKIRQSFIRILPGDRVRVEVNRYDSTRVRIIYRLRDKVSKD